MECLVCKTEESDENIINLKCQGKYDHFMCKECFYVYTDFVKSKCPYCSTEIDFTNEKFGSREEQMEEHYLNMITESSLSLREVPIHRRNTAICKKAMTLNCLCIRDVPDDILTDDFLKFALKQDTLFLFCLPREKLTTEICNFAIDCSPCGALRGISCFGTVLTEEMCFRAVAQNNDAMLYVPEEMKTNNLCWFAVSRCHYRIQSVPLEKRKYKICKMVLDGWGLDPFVKHHIPKEHIKKWKWEKRIEFLKNLF